MDDIALFVSVHLVKTVNILNKHIIILDISNIYWLLLVVTIYSMFIAKCTPLYGAQGMETTAGPPTHTKCS